LNDPLDTKATRTHIHQGQDQGSALKKQDDGREVTQSSVENNQTGDQAKSDDESQVAGDLSLHLFAGSVNIVVRYSDGTEALCEGFSESRNVLSSFTEEFDVMVHLHGSPSKKDFSMTLTRPEVAKLLQSRDQEDYLNGLTSFEADYSTLPHIAESEDSKARKPEICASPSEEEDKISAGAGIVDDTVTHSKLGDQRKSTDSPGEFGHTVIQHVPGAADVVRPPANVKEYRSLQSTTHQSAAPPSIITSQNASREHSASAKPNIWADISNQALQPMSTIKKSPLGQFASVSMWRGQQEARTDEDLNVVSMSKATKSTCEWRLSELISFIVPAIKPSDLVNFKLTSKSILNLIEGTTCYVKSDITCAKFAKGECISNAKFKSAVFRAGRNGTFYPLEGFLEQEVKFREITSLVYLGEPISAYGTSTTQYRTSKQCQGTLSVLRGIFALETACERMVEHRRDHSRMKTYKLMYEKADPGAKNFRRSIEAFTTTGDVPRMLFSHSVGGIQVMTLIKVERFMPYYATETCLMDFPSLQQFNIYGCAMFTLAEFPNQLLDFEALLCVPGRRVTVDWDFAEPYEAEWRHWATELPKLPSMVSIIFGGAPTENFPPLIEDISAKDHLPALSQLTLKDIERVLIHKGDGLFRLLYGSKHKRFLILRKHVAWTMKAAVDGNEGFVAVIMKHFAWIRDSHDFMDYLLLPVVMKHQMHFSLQEVYGPGDNSGTFQCNYCTKWIAGILWDPPQRKYAKDGTAMAKCLGCKWYTMEHEYNYDRKGVRKTLDVGTQYLIANKVNSIADFATLNFRKPARSAGPSDDVTSKEFSKVCPDALVNMECRLEKEHGIPCKMATPQVRNFTAVEGKS
jgi:hypothetical protein